MFHSENGLGERLQSRDRRPRLSAPTFHVTLQAVSLMRTDEGVCPYVVASLWIERII
ncbi:hypothetical protein HMPREF0973_02320 [Prevotella veroralis F0319]|uniref:Uncharacterized protein n=1 Tax=Prevotella veroralis F0319 TaxID=649761 RepID=C9MRQ7_9BACT|nr:hypothetical protein HMPREF0973_02320 [Prevotella veroralis F0319]